MRAEIGHLEIRSKCVRQNVFQLCSTKLVSFAQLAGLSGSRHRIRDVAIGAGIKLQAV